MSWKTAIAAVVAVAAVVVAVVLIADFGDDDSAEASETDGAFMAEMTAHHEAAIEMAEMAQERGERAEVKGLAEEIIAAQSGEIERFSSIHDQMFGEPMSSADHGTLGMSASEMGMEMNMSELESAQPFDQAFIDAMVAHHQGAIRMARVELEQGEDDELAEIAEAIIAAQSAEIEQMNAWRQQWYGAPSPAGGAPSEGETEAPSHEMMGH
ncbi:MAG: DUF305 domain-containing protein [Solirubrobacterales bacterium]